LTKLQIKLDGFQCAWDTLQYRLKESVLPFRVMMNRLISSQHFISNVAWSVCNVRLMP